MELEARLSAEIPANQPIMAWIVRRAGDAITKKEIKASGITRYQSIHGRPYRGMESELGRKVLYYIHGRRGSDLRGRWSTGIWLGETRSSDEHIIATELGSTFHARTIRNLTEVDSWDAESVPVGT